MVSQFDFVFDIDETLVSGDVIYEASNILFNEKTIDRIYTNKDCMDWELSNLPECLVKKVREFYHHPFYAVWNKEIIKGCYSFIYALHHLGFNLALLTARPIELIKPTVQYFNQIFPDIFDQDNIFFSNKNGKKQYLEILKPDFFFDDNPEYCKQAKDLGIETYLVSNSYTSWNHGKAKEIGCEEIKNVCFFDLEHILKNK